MQRKEPVFRTTSLETSKLRLNHCKGSLARPKAVSSCPAGHRGGSGSIGCGRAQSHGPIGCWLPVGALNLSVGHQVWGSPCCCVVQGAGCVTFDLHSVEATMWVAVSIRGQADTDKMTSVDKL